MESLTFAFADKAQVPGFVGADVQAEVIDHILQVSPDKILLVCDAGAEAHHADYFKSLNRSLSGCAAPGESPCLDLAAPDVERYVLPAGDECKSWDHLSNLMRWSFDIGTTKRSVIVAFGGGALLNVTGLFASILFRGTKVIYVPTTFLAMHDVVTSLKTSICFDGRKNNIGSFYAPTKILIDVGFCRTLPRQELFSGLGELAKNALLFGGKHAEGFVAALSKEQVNAAHGGSGDELAMDDKTLMTLVSLGIDAKMSMLATDAYEKTSGMVFEYGHTVSHAIEKAYGDGVIPHGLGVTYGMLSTSYAAERLGIMTPEDRAEHDELCWLLLKRWPLPQPRPTIEKIMAFAMRDSKRGLTGESDDEISDVMLTKIGEVVPTKTNNLSKFPCAHISKWLYTMGFPHEGATQPVHSSTLTKKDCDLLVETIHSSSQSDLIGLGFEPMTVGFANHVWATEKHKQALVVKSYTELAYLRVDAEAIGVVDILAGEKAVGPRVLFSSSQGLVMERVEGRTLEEADMHKADFRLLDMVAQALATLHQLSVPKVCDGLPMVWRTMDKMLEVAKRRPELWPEDMPALEEVCSEVATSRQMLDRKALPVVLCHGDFKPSNVILGRNEDSVSIIDHELAGPNYRGFDLMKIFRTELKPSAASMEHFLRSYLESTGKPTSDSDLADIIQETKMFEPLTWLEAACFFLAMPQLKPQQTSFWNELAADRWTKYMATKGAMLTK